MQMFESADDVGDERLMVAKELLRTEDTYLENLKNIFDIYMEPLKWVFFLSHNSVYNVMMQCVLCLVCVLW